jgi:cell wall-associated NlpC family hydrolase
MPNGLIDPTQKFPYKTLDINTEALVTLTEKMIGNVVYRMGAKAPGLDCDSNTLKALDCSGFIRYVTAKCTDGLIDLPDGSDNQHQWFKRNGFKESTIQSGTRKDDILRIAFLTPADGNGIGHVAYILNGETMESHGHTTGVDMRQWNMRGWQASTYVYVVRLA